MTAPRYWRVPPPIQPTVPMRRIGLAVILTLVVLGTEAQAPPRRSMLERADQLIR